jgi:hypothetical protein
MAMDDKDPLLSMLYRHRRASVDDNGPWFRVEMKPLYNRLQFLDSSF